MAGERTTGPRQSFILDQTGYLIDGVDLADLAEPYDHADSVVNTGSVDFTNYYTRGGETFNTQFASPTQDWNTITTNFFQGENPIKLAKKGFVPTSSKMFATFSSINDEESFYIKRGTDDSGDYIQIGYAYYRTSAFGNLGFVPYYIGIIMCGGGGGSGGNGGKTGNKYGWNATCGGGGGGGAALIGVIDLSSSDHYYQINLGSGGAGGTSKSQGTAGGDGVNGSTTFLIRRDSDGSSSMSYASGGKGGTGGKTGSSGNLQGSGGKGGTGAGGKYLITFTGQDGGTSVDNDEYYLDTIDSLSETIKFEGAYERTYTTYGCGSEFYTYDSGRGNAIPYVTRANGGASLLGSGAGLVTTTYTSETPFTAAGPGGGGAAYFHSSGAYYNYGGNGIAYFFY